ncbi:hypothetical protein SDC9_203161 [bioreactor metagenome]|uniref:Uncharacterized protein n=1 Tax=bioreactor metagenome TaxID=1076179 RepID=A0A645IYF2_9ZZZZ
MHVDRGRGARADRFANQRTDGQVGNIMAVHHVKVNPVGPRGDDVGHFLAQLGEIGGQNARCNDVGQAVHGGLQKKRPQTSGPKADYRSSENGGISGTARSFFPATPA